VRLAYRVDDFTDPWRAPRDPVLLLHPAMGAYRRWYAWIPILARRFPAVSLDLRGHGASEVPDESKPLTVERLVQDVRELLDARGASRARTSSASRPAAMSGSGSPWNRRSASPPSR
jgi:3-oxoadipate enol-lactonase